ncbi:MAG: DUF1269 domain-containing protein [Caldilinea sp.]
MGNTEEQGIPAVGFLVAAFLDEKAADQALDAMKAAKKDQRFYFEDAAVIRQDAKGTVHYHETGDMKAGKGAGIGALVGGVLGILGGPGGAVLGAGVGAAIGGAMAGGDKGFRNESLSTVGVALQPETSAVAVITSRAFLKAVQQQVPLEEIRTAVANLSTELTNGLAEDKNVAIGVLLSEQGLAIKKIAVNSEVAEVVGAVITDDAVLLGAAVVTAEGVAYELVGETAEGAVAEAGVFTEEGGIVADVVVTAESEATTGEIAATDAPEEEAKE